MSKRNNDGDIWGILLIMGAATVFCLTGLFVLDARLDHLESWHKPACAECWGGEG